VQGKKARKKRTVHTVEGVVNDRGKDASGVSQANNVKLRLGEALHEVISRDVGGAAGENLGLGAVLLNELVDNLDYRGGLSRSRRPVDKGHIRGGEGKRNGLLLGLVEGIIQVLQIGVLRVRLKPWLLLSKQDLHQVIF